MGTLNYPADETGEHNFLPFIRFDQNIIEGNIGYTKQEGIFVVTDSSPLDTYGISLFMVNGIACGIGRWAVEDTVIVFLNDGEPAVDRSDIAPNFTGIPANNHGFPANGPVPIFFLGTDNYDGVLFTVQNGTTADQIVISHPYVPEIFSSTDRAVSQGEDIAGQPFFDSFQTEYNGVPYEIPVFHCRSIVEPYIFAIEGTESGAVNIFGPGIDLIHRAGIVDKRVFRAYLNKDGSVYLQTIKDDLTTVDFTRIISYLDGMLEVCRGPLKVANPLGPAKMLLNYDAPFFGPTELGSYEWTAQGNLLVRGAKIVAKATATWGSPADHDNPAKIEFYTQTPGPLDGLSIPAGTLDENHTWHFGEPGTETQIDKNGDVDFINGGGLKFAGICAVNNATPSTFLVKDVWYKITVLIHACGASNSLTPDPANNRISVGTAGTFLVMVNLSYINPSPNDKFEFQVRLDPGTVDNIESLIQVDTDNANSKASPGKTWFIYVPAGGSVILVGRCTSAANRSITLNVANLGLLKIGSSAP
jgi:hypothetical protein